MMNEGFHEVNKTRTRTPNDVSGLVNDLAHLGVKPDGAKPVNEAG